MKNDVKVWVFSMSCRGGHSLSRVAFPLWHWVLSSPFWLSEAGIRYVDSGTQRWCNSLAIARPPPLVHLYLCCKKPKEKCFWSNHLPSSLFYFYFQRNLTDVNSSVGWHGKRALGYEFSSYNSEFSFGFYKNTVPLVPRKKEFGSQHTSHSCKTGQLICCQGSYTVLWLLIWPYLTNLTSF